MINHQLIRFAGALLAAIVFTLFLGVVSNVLISSPPAKTPGFALPSGEPTPAPAPSAK